MHEDVKVGIGTNSQKTMLTITLYITYNIKEKIYLVSAIQDYIRLLNTANISRLSRANLRINVVPYSSFNVSLATRAYNVTVNCRVELISVTKVKHDSKLNTVKIITMKILQNSTKKNLFNLQKKRKIIRALNYWFSNFLFCSVFFFFLKSCFYILAHFHRYDYL